MALRRLPYKRLQELIGSHLSTREYPDTQRVIDGLREAKKRGYITKPELVEVCWWKSARGMKHIKRNRPEMIRTVTRGAFKTRSERKKLELLTSLHGVGVPMASSILTLTNPKRYGVIDIRVWQLLFEMGSVDGNGKGVGFKFDQWHRFLT